MQWAPFRSTRCFLCNAMLFLLRFPAHGIVNNDGWWQWRLQQQGVLRDYISGALMRMYSSTACVRQAGSGQHLGRPMCPSTHAF